MDKADGLTSFVQPTRCDSMPLDGHSDGNPPASRGTSTRHLDAAWRRATVR